MGVLFDSYITLYHFNIASKVVSVDLVYILTAGLPELAVTSRENQCFWTLYYAEPLEHCFKSSLS